METQSSLPNKVGGAPQFSAHFYSAQTAGCIKMPLGMEAGLSSGEFVLDGDPAPLIQKGRSPLSNFKGLGWEFRNWTESVGHFRL